MMKFGMIGLGKMGMNLVKNAVDHEIEVVAYDLNTKAVEEAKDYSDKITAVSTIEKLLTELPASKTENPFPSSARKRLCAWEFISYPKSSVKKCFMSVDSTRED